MIKSVAVLRGRRKWSPQRLRCAPLQHWRPPGVGPVDGPEITTPNSWELWTAHVAPIKDSWHYDLRDWTTDKHRDLTWLNKKLNSEMLVISKCVVIILMLYLTNPKCDAYSSLKAWAPRPVRPCGQSPWRSPPSCSNNALEKAGGMSKPPTVGWFEREDLEVKVQTVAEIDAWRALKFRESRDGKKGIREVKNVETRRK